MGESKEEGTATAAQCTSAARRPRHCFESKGERPRPPHGGEHSLRRERVERFRAINAKEDERKHSTRGSGESKEEQSKEERPLHDGALYQGPRVPCLRAIAIRLHGWQRALERHAMHHVDNLTAVLNKQTHTHGRELQDELTALMSNPAFKATAVPAEIAQLVATTREAMRRHQLSHQTAHDAELKVFECSGVSRPLSDSPNPVGQCQGRRGATRNHSSKGEGGVGGTITGIARATEVREAALRVLVAGEVRLRMACARTTMTELYSNVDQRFALLSQQETAHVHQREAALRDAEARRQQRAAAAAAEAARKATARRAAAAAAAATAAAATAKQQAKRGQPTRLYHVTSKAAALSIQRSGKMKKGSQGAYGGGIYFASSRESANYKAHSKGYVIEADVYLGNPLQVSSAGDHSLRELEAKGYNSVHAARGPGGGNPEWVVYSGDQVEIRSVTAY